MFAIITAIETLYSKYIKRPILKLFVLISAKKTGNGLRVNKWTIVTKQTQLGNNVNFNGLKIIGSGQVTIGDNFHSGSECLLITETHNYNTGKAIPYDNTTIKKIITIEDNVWLGTRVIVLGNTCIGEGAIIQAGSVVVRDIPRFAIAGGSPAKVFAYRDKKHYAKLKDEGKFY